MRPRGKQLDDDCQNSASSGMRNVRCRGPPMCQLSQTCSGTHLSPGSAAAYALRQRAVGTRGRVAVPPIASAATTRRRRRRPAFVSLPFSLVAFVFPGVSTCVTQTACLGRMEHETTRGRSTLPTPRSAGPLKGTTAGQDIVASESRASPLPLARQQRRPTPSAARTAAP